MNVFLLWYSGITSYCCSKVHSPFLLIYKYVIIFLLLLRYLVNLYFIVFVTTVLRVTSVQSPSHQERCLNFLVHDCIHFLVL